MLGSELDSVRQDALDSAIHLLSWDMHLAPNSERISP